jgi:thiol-disulfide isomerase/thioredoxin
MKFGNISLLKNNKMICLGLVFVVLLIVVGIGLITYKKHYSNEEHFGSGAKKTLYFFRAEWCGHCQRFKPVWDDFVHDAMTSNDFPNIEIVELDIDKEESKPLVQKHNVHGFPHVVLAEEGNSDVVFNEARTKEALKQFCKNNL